MNKWIVLVATMLLALGFSSTIMTTINFPSTSNVIISSSLMASIIIGLFVFSKSDKIKKEESYDGFEPVK